jgi:hypothetical protein
MLTQTLRRLQDRGVVARRRLAGAPPGDEYRWTKLGETLLEPVRALPEWAEGACGGARVVAVIAVAARSAVGHRPCGPERSRGAAAVWATSTARARSSSAINEARSFGLNASARCRSRTATSP